MSTLFGDADVPAVSPSRNLARAFGEPPFSILDRRSRRWQDRSAQWRRLGIASEEGRDAPLGGSGFSGLMRIAARPQGMSIFDPTLAELAYRWWSLPGDLVLDPFAGGSVRGIVAAMLGRWYTGIDLRPEQVEANRRQADEVCDSPMPRWLTGDADDLDLLLPDAEADFVLTCPPYHDLEVYSDDPADLSAMDWDTFELVYRRIIARAAARLRPDRYMALVVGDRRGPDGAYRGLPWLTIDAIRGAGLALHQDAVILDPCGSLQLTAARTMEAGRKLTRLHQYLIVGVKGDPRRAAKRLRVDQ